VYFEDAANSASRSALFEQDVQKADTTLNITTTATSLTVGTPITISAEINPVKPGAGSPSGQILVVLGNNSSCVIVLPSGSCQLTPVDTIGVTLIGSYGGDVNFNSSTSNTLTFAPPHKADTQIVLTAGSNPSPPAPFLQAIVYGPELVLGSEPEVVVIKDGTTDLCQVDSLGTGPLNGGYASCYSGVALTPGQHTLTATYSGDTNHNGSSSTLVLNVYDGRTSMSVSFSPNPARVGEPVTATFNVSASDPQFAPPSSPSGLVSLTIASPSAYCYAFLATTKSCTFTPSQVGTLNASISYTGDNYYRSATLGTSLDVLADTGGFFPLTPARLLDTRAGFATSDGQFAGGGSIGQDGRVDLLVASRAGVPAQGVVAAVLNVTVTNPSAAGYITAWSSGQPRPLTSNLNFSVGQTVANLAIVPLGADGKVSLFNAFGTTDLIVDVAGYFLAGTDANVFTPSRLLDTRAGQPTFDGQFEGSGALAAGWELDLAIDGRYGIPSTGVGAVILNVTAVNPTAPGYFTVWPDDVAQPLSSNLNFTPGQVVANLVISRIGNNGGVSIFNSLGTTDVVADVQGWFPLTSQFTAILPARLMDSRSGALTIDGQFAGTGALIPSSLTNLAVLGRAGVPSSGVSAVVLNVTATGPTAPGYLTVLPAGSALPNSSNLNFVAGQTVPNLVVTKVGSNGSVALYNGTLGTTGVVVDVMGWFADSPP